MAEPGHLFVVRGDLTRIHTDAHLIPCDGGANVSDFWSDFLADEDLVPSREPQRLRLRRVDHVDEGLPDVSLPDMAAGGTSRVRVSFRGGV
jgi:hypothetical protein